MCAVVVTFGEIVSQHRVNTKLVMCLTQLKDVFEPKL